jgi:hypothetical protein
LAIGGLTSASILVKATNLDNLRALICECFIGNVLISYMLNNPKMLPILVSVELYNCYFDFVLALDSI